MIAAADLSSSVMVSGLGETFQRVMRLAFNRAIQSDYIIELIGKQTFSIKMWCEHIHRIYKFERIERLNGASLVPLSTQLSRNSTRWRLSPTELTHLATVYSHHQNKRSGQLYASTTCTNNHLCVYVCV